MSTTASNPSAHHPGAALAADGPRWLLLSLTAAVLLGGCVLLGRQLGALHTWIGSAVGFGVVGGGLVIATAAAWRRRALGPGAIGVVVVVGVACRLVLMPDGRWLSDDACRYHFDGKVLLGGINPYRYAPNDPALDHLRVDSLDAQINHPERHTVYPPLAQLYFALAYLLSPGELLGFRLLGLLSELVTWALLLVFLIRRGWPRAWWLVAAWSPLILLEGYLPGHLDLLGLPWLTAFVICAEGRRPVGTGLCLALACLIKPLAVIFLPAAAWQLGARRSLLAALTASAVVTLAYLPFASAGWHLFRSMWLMAHSWSVNGSLAALLEALLPRAAARLVAAGLLVASLLLAVRWGRDLLSRLLLAVAAFAVCSPTVFPWYLVWMFPLLALRPDPSLLTLGALVPIAEVVSIGWWLERTWQLPLWASLAQYVPFYALLGLSAWRGWGMFARRSTVGGP